LACFRAVVEKSTKPASGAEKKIFFIAAAEPPQ
jgi:hypothetical protein